MIYPKIQKNHLDGNAVKVSSVRISGDYKEKAEKILGSYSIDTNGEYAVEIKISNTRKTT